jgi:hypothetical protein
MPTISNDFYREHAVLKQWFRRYALLDRPIFVPSPALRSLLISGKPLHDRSFFLDDCTPIYAGWTTHNHTVQWESPDWPSIKLAFQNLPRICVQNPTFTNHETGLATHYGQEASRASRPLPGQQGAIWCSLGARCGWVLFPPSWAASKEGWKKN